MPEILIQPPIGEPIDLAEAKLQLRITEASQDAIVRAMLSAARQAAETKTRQQMLHARWKLVIDRFPMAGVGTPLPFANTVNIPGYAILLPHAPVVQVVKIEYLDVSSGTLLLMPAGDYVVNTAFTPALVTPKFGKIWPIPLPQIGAVQITYDAGYASPVALNAAAPTRFFRVAGPVTWNVGDLVQFYNSGGALPPPLAAQTPYLIDSAAAGVYSVTDFAAAPITFSAAGYGSNYIGVVPEGLRAWTLIRMGSLYENREEVAILSRGRVQELPFIDGLLDPYMTTLP